MRKVITNHKLTYGGTNIPEGIPRPMMVYCKRCGAPMMWCQTAEDGSFNATLEEEFKLRVCHRCYPIEIKEMEEAMKKAMEPTRAEQEEADKKYEEAVAKYMKELEQRGSDTGSNK